MRDGRGVQALEGVRVIELTAGMAGPWIGRFMAYCGAEVIKVESVARPDVTRQYISPSDPGGGVQSQLSPWLTDWNAGKLFVALDLTNPRAIELAKRLVERADVVIDNYASGVVDKLGLGYGALRAVRPDLIMLSSTGYGSSGPHSRYISWGPNIEALSGIGMLGGFPGDGCTMTQYAYPDVVGAMHGTFAVLAALDHRRRTGEGQHIDLAQVEASVAAIGDVVMESLVNGDEPERRGNRSQNDAPHGCYRCAGEDRWCAIAVRSDEQWRALCGAIGRRDLAGEPRFATAATRLAHQDELDVVIERWTRRRDAHEVMHRLQEVGVAAGVAQTIEDKLERDPQLAARGYFETVPHAVKGEVVADGIPLGLTATPGRTTASGAEIGADNEAVFGGILGITREEIEEAVAEGAIEDPFR